MELDEQARAHIEDVIGHRFSDPSLIDLAFLHASTTDRRLESNERLEFLGDAVLGSVVCTRIFKMFPDMLEGDMTKIKSTTVSRRTCAKITRELGLVEHLELGKGMLTQDEVPSSLVAAVLESVVGAVFLDGGYAAAERFLVPLVDPHIKQAAESGHHQNFKSLLQQHAQRELECSPSYRCLDEKGPDHAKAFQVCVEIGGQRFEPAWGSTKKQAEQKAAVHALLALNVITRSDDGTHQMASDDSDEVEAALDDADEMTTN